MYNVILIDDEVRTIDALEKNVDWKKCGIRKVYKATNMQNAIHLITTEDIEILVCDIEMPNGSGLQILEWVRQHECMINCIFVTCHPEFSYMRKAIQLNCYDYILKPINYDEFSEVLIELVHKMENMEMSGVQEMDISQKLMNSVVLEKPKVRSERNVEMDVKKYIKDHMVDAITVTDIAEELHFNPQYLTRIFKNKTGMSILEYLTNERINTAKNILERTDIPIKSIAVMVGYEDYAYFTRVFKKEMGISPSQFRHQRGK